MNRNLKNWIFRIFWMNILRGFESRLKTIFYFFFFLRSRKFLVSMIGELTLFTNLLTLFLWREVVEGSASNVSNLQRISFIFLEFSRDSSLQNKYWVPFFVETIFLVNVNSLHSLPFFADSSSHSLRRKY